MLGQEILLDLKGKSILITGGSGFFGKNLCEFLKPLGIKIHVLARSKPDIEGVLHIPHDVTQPFNFDLKVDYIIHAATSAVLDSDQQFQKTLDVIINGTQNALDYAERINCKKFLLISSGAVYGKQSAELEKIPEDLKLDEPLMDFKSAYATGKRISELFAFDWAKRTKKNCTIARCFAFSGKYLPLDKHFAIGNFVEDALANKLINIKGDGTTIRSYMDADDLMVWLITIMLKGESGEAYNVGSDQAISIKDLASKVAAKVPGTFVILQHTGTRTTARYRYIPSIEKAKKKLGLSLTIKLETSIEKMLEYNKGLKNE
jgi:dTDP-glucose 4,6-dehydratase